MTDFENAYVGMGTSPHLDFDFKAIAGDKKTWSPTWGFVTKNWMSDLEMFKIGGSFGGFYYGVQGYGDDPDDKENSGPQVNEYSDFAGVFVRRRGYVRQQLRRLRPAWGDPDSRIPQKMSAGVFGAAAELEPGVVGWSTKGIGGMGLSYSGRGVLGQSAMGGGVVGISDQSVGVQGYSGNSVGILGMTSNPASLAGAFFGNVAIAGNLVVGGTKSAVVPFPDGSRRALYCMESPDLWFEDFGSAKLARGRAVVKLDANFAKVIKRGDYRVFVTPEGIATGSICAARVLTASRCVSLWVASRASRFPTASSAVARISSNTGALPKSTCLCRLQPMDRAPRVSSSSRRGACVRRPRGEGGAGAGTEGCGESHSTNAHKASKA